MNTKFADKVFRVLMILAFVLGTVWMPNTNARAEAPSPNIYARPQLDWIDGWDWSPGETITLSIDDPSTGPGIDYSTSKEILDNSFRFQIGDFYDIKPDDIVTVYGNVSDITKEHVVNHVSITHVDLNSQTAFGFASPNVRVQVDIDIHKDCSGTGNTVDITSDENGDWEADFSGLCEINPGDHMSAKEWDDDGDFTMFDYSIFSPKITVSLHRNAVIDQNWPENATLTLSIDDPSNGLGEDYTAQIIAGQGETFPHAYLGFALYDAFQIQPGHIVTVSGGGYSVTHIVKDLRITNVDSENDIVSGKCTPGSEVRVTVSNLGQRTVFVLVDPAGNWSVDFSEPVEEFTYDITPATVMTFHCYDKESISGETESIHPVHFAVWVDGVVSGLNWKIGQPVILEIDDPATQQSPDFSDVGWPEPGPWFYTGLRFSTQAINLQPGFLVTATQGTQVQTHIITGITINEVNVDEDTVSGTANPNAYVLVGVNSGDEGLRLVQADGEGNWTADYKVPGSLPPWQATADILEDTYVSASEFDNDGNHTVVSWHLAKPNIEVRLDGNSVTGYNWPLETDITITIDNPATPDISVDYSATAQMAQSPWAGQAVVYFDLNNLYEVKPGDIVTLHGGGYTRSHTVFDGLSVTSANVDSDTVSGTVLEEGAFIQVNQCDENGCADRYIESVIGTTWTVDFSVEGPRDDEKVLRDLQPGMGGEVMQYDEGGGSTVRSWYIPNPTMTLKGFYQPVDMNGVYNTVKGGSTVPLKFEVFAGSTELTNVADIKTLSYAQTSCNAIAITDEIELTATGNTSLRYSGGQFIYNWKTPKTTGCFRVTVTTIDGSTLVAYFKLK